MQQLQQTQKLVEAVNGELVAKKRSRPKKTGSQYQSNNNIFDPNKYMLKLPKNKKVDLSNGQIKWEKVETEYLPVAAFKAKKSPLFFTPFLSQML
jgi:hypothetical protein